MRNGEAFSPCLTDPHSGSMEFFVGFGNVVLVLCIVFLNAFFVAAEFAIVKVRATQIESLSRGGQRRARRAHQVVTHLDTYLSASQLGITMTSLGLGWVGEPAVAHMLEPGFILAGIADPAIITTISFGVGFTLITFLHIVLGEQAPKWLAIQQAQRVTLIVAAPLHVFYVVFRPFIWLLNMCANYFVRLVGIQPGNEGELVHSEEELRMLLSKGKAISSTGRSILLNTLELRDRTVREVMVPRTAIVYLSTDRTIEQNIAVALENQFTRYPLCEKNLDNVLGMIHLKDLFRLRQQQGPGDHLLSIKREMLFVPETMALERGLTTFLTKRVLMAMAVDEHGGTAGLLTLENVLEELVGEIRDEFDVEPQQVQKLSEKEYLVDGAMALHDFARMFGIRPRSKDVVTLSGYVIQLLGRVPERGAELIMGPWHGSVESLENRKIKQLRLKRHDHEPRTEE
jgi:CBS domain containing-hemolysin-like protein